MTHGDGALGIERADGCPIALEGHVGVVRYSKGLCSLLPQYFTA